jgi:hypothetical protein
MRASYPDYFTFHHFKTLVMFAEESIVKFHIMSVQFPYFHALIFKYFPKLSICKQPSFYTPPAGWETKLNVYTEFYI